MNRKRLYPGRIARCGLTVLAVLLLAGAGAFATAKAIAIEPQSATHSGKHPKNAEGQIYKVGGDISAPVLLNTVAAKYTDKARRAKYQGVCLIQMTVDAQGNPQNPRVVRPLGMGLDEKALEAVRQYKFKPAMKDGKTPVAVMVTIEVNFKLY